jgi:hypothetical protein
VRVQVQEVESLMQKRCTVTGDEELLSKGEVDEQVSEQEGVNPVGSVRAHFVAKKRVSGPARDSAGSALLQRSAAQCSGVNGAAGEKCWGVLGSAASCFRPSADRAEDETPRPPCHWPRCFLSATLPEDFGLVLGPLRG